MNRNIVITADGSTTIFSQEVNQHYHSYFGALQETMHVFIEAGLCSGVFANSNRLSILEIGFGTGLNALLTYFRAHELHKDIFYEALELFPLTVQEVALLNYPALLPYPNVKEIFTTLHSTAWNKKQLISKNFSLHKHHTSALEYRYPVNTFDLVYFDAFSPEAQPEMWTKEIFSAIYKSMKTEGVLVTYSTKGVIKRTLQSLGFEIEKLPGPVGKREMLRARKS